MSKMIIMGGDISFAKSGFHIAEINNKGIKMIHSELYVTNKESEPIERINETIERLMYLHKKYKVDLIIKEGAIMGRSSTGLNVIKTHGAVEYFCFDNLIPIEDIHNATLKAFCRRYLIDNSFYTKEELKQFDKKQIVAEFLKTYFDSDMPEIYTARRKLIDDKSDAIALSIYYHEKINKNRS